MNTIREQLLGILGELSQVYPNWRLGQMMANLTDWAKQPATADQAAGAVWDIEDEELLATAREHLNKRLAQLRHEAEGNRINA